MHKTEQNQSCLGFTLIFSRVRRQVTPKFLLRDVIAFAQVTIPLIVLLFEFCLAIHGIVYLPS